MWGQGGAWVLGCCRLGLCCSLLARLGVGIGLWGYLAGENDAFGLVGHSGCLRGKGPWRCGCPGALGLPVAELLKTEI